MKRRRAPSLLAVLALVGLAFLPSCSSGGGEEQDPQRQIDPDQEKETRWDEMNWDEGEWAPEGE